MVLLCIGDELLDGRTADRNAHHLGGVAAALGVPLVQVRVVDDRPDVIAREIAALAEDGRLIVTSGGLGPTLDDRTREAVAQAAGEALEHDADAEARIRARFVAMRRQWVEVNARQAHFPRSSTVLPSDCGTADAFLTKVGPSQVLSLPGVPHEFRTLFHRYGVPLISSGDRRYQESRVFFGLGESAIASVIEGEGFEHVDITYKATAPYIEIGVRGSDEIVVQRTLGAISERMGRWLVPDGHRTFTHALAAIATATGATVATVESCTGGLIAKELTDVSGASAYYWGGWVTYDDSAKIRCVGVDSALLREHGAVSEPVAAAMARGAQARSGASAAVSVTGIAGPGGGSDQKPVGLVYVGVVGPSANMVVKATFAGRSRESFRRHVAALAQRALLASLDGGADAIGEIAGVEWCRTFE